MDGEILGQSKSLQLDGLLPFLYLSLIGKYVWQADFQQDEMTARVADHPRLRGEQHIPSLDDINNFYYEAAGGMKKSRLYGLGSQVKVIFPHAMSTSSGRGRPSSSSPEIEELRAENEELRARMATLEESRVGMQN